jgi:hypothetical protein
MTYKEEVRDLFSVPDDYYLAHCISADFEMGKGIAVEFNKHFDMKNKLKTKYPDYIYKFGSGGECLLEGRVLNLVTKARYFQKPTMSTLSFALRRMKCICLGYNITKVAMPTIGCGLDRL